MIHSDKIFVVQEYGLWIVYFSRAVSNAFLLAWICFQSPFGQELVDVVRYTATILFQMQRNNIFATLANHE